MFYDVRNFLTIIQHENTLTPAILADYTCGYDLAGNRTSMTDVLGSVTTNITWDYAVNRLVEVHNDRNDIGYTSKFSTTRMAITLVKFGAIPPVRNTQCLICDIMPPRVIQVN